MFLMLRFERYRVIIEKKQGSDFRYENQIL